MKIINKIFKIVLYNSLAFLLFTSLVMAQSQTLYLPGTAESVIFYAPVSGDYRFTITGGAWSPVPEETTDTLVWLAWAHIYKNRSVDYEPDPNRPGLWKSVVPDFVIGSQTWYPSYETAEAAGRGLFVDIPLNEGDYLVFHPPGHMGWAYDNRGGMYFSIGLVPDLRVESVKTVQVIDKADLDGDNILDLVAGKSTAVFADIKIINGDNIIGDARKNIYTDLILNGRIIESNKSTVDQLMNNGRIEFYFEPTASNGNVDLTVEVDSFRQVPESNENNNKYDPPIKVNIKDKKGLFLVYVPIDPHKKSDFKSFNDETYRNMTSKSGRFISATYPISWFSLLPIYTRYKGNPCSRTKDLDCERFSIIKDLEGIIKKVEKTGITYDRIVGVVPAGYFEYHNLSTTTGIWFPDPSINKAAIVQEGFLTSPAHEIGHSYGLLKKPEEYETNYPGNTANGFWVNEKREISNGFCFMGTHADYNSFYGQNRAVWIDDEDYEFLFNNIN